MRKNALSFRFLSFKNFFPLLFLWSSIFLFCFSFQFYFMPAFLIKFCSMHSTLCETKYSGSMHASFTQQLQWLQGIIIIFTQLVTRHISVAKATNRRHAISTALTTDGKSEFKVHSGKGHRLACINTSYEWLHFSITFSRAIGSLHRLCTLS